MKVFIKKNYEEMSQHAAAIILGQMNTAGRQNLSLTVGATPARTYELVVDKLKGDESAYQHVHFYNFDEIPLAGEKEGLTVKGLRDYFYTPAETPEENIHQLNLDNYKEYDAQIENDGGIDLMFMGLGGDGHFCGNMPISTKFDSLSYEIPIDKKYPWYGTFEDIFASIEGQEVPETFVSMGPESVLRVKQVVMVVNGAGKAETVKKFLETPVTEEFPSSILKLHPNFTVILDEEAASLL